jgi:hypothetical protein
VRVPEVRVAAAVEALGQAEPTTTMIGIDEARARSVRRLLRRPAGCTATRG